MTKRNYVSSLAKIVRKNPKESKFASISKLMNFRAAMRDHVKANWSHYQFAKSKGYNPETYTDLIIGQIEKGMLRTFDRNDPTIRGACAQLMIPNTYKAIEGYLK